MTPDQLFAIARQHRLAKRFNAALPLYQQILARDPRHIRALHDLAGLYEEVGQLTTAHQCLLRLVTLAPSDGGAWNDLGRVLARLGKTTDAAPCFVKAVNLAPNLAEAHNNLGNTLREASRFDEAKACYERSITLEARYAEAHYNLANTLRDLKQPEAAIEAYQRAIGLRPDLHEAYNNLGNAMLDVRRADDALAVFDQLLALKPDHAKAHNNRGSALRALDRLDEAMASIEKAILLKPDYAMAYNNRGVILKDQGRLTEAMASFQKAIHLKSDFAEALDNLCGILRDIGRLDEVVAVCHRAIAHNPGYAQAHHCLGAALTEMGLIDDAALATEQALLLRPDYAEAINNLGNIHRDKGQLDLAIDHYRKALALMPKSAAIGSNLVYTLQFHADYDPPALLRENRQWALTHEQPLRNLQSRHRRYANNPSPNRRLRIGYVSPDFRMHCAACFLLPLLANHNAGAVEVFCYSGVRRADEITERFKAMPHVWRDAATMSDTMLAAQIEEDRIDVLVDCTLHMAGSRLLTCARRPAPVQVTWLGYPGTTGMAGIDYRLTDPYLDPAGMDESVYSEKTLRLPHTFWCYQPLIQTDGVNALPALTNGYLTFGCFNNFVKVTPQTLALWAKVLGALDDARLILLAPFGQTRQRVLADFAAAGIAPARIEFVGRCGMADYFRLYHRVDLCLDTIPYPGHTTSMDGLWMGVPPLTLPGNTVASRGGASLLSNVGLTDLVAKTPPDFVEIAKRLARDIRSLAALRATLRPTMQASPLMDAKRFARDMERAFADMWTAWLPQLS